MFRRCQPSGHEEGVHRTLLAPLGVGRSNDHRDGDFLTYVNNFGGILALGWDCLLGLSVSVCTLNKVIYGLLAHTCERIFTHRTNPYPLKPSEGPLKPSE